jgi:hypothetical protein
MSSGSVGDLNQPDSLETAFRDVVKLFLLSPGPDVPAQDATLVQAAQRGHLNHVVMLSSLGAELGGIGGGRPHIPGEQRLRDSSAGYTAGLVTSSGTEKGKQMPKTTALLVWMFLYSRQGRKKGEELRQRMQAEQRASP